jgi:phosphatidylserine/phosphatidylglycerophosphate/cardiolipin synthase-like enzyme
MKWNYVFVLIFIAGAALFFFAVPKFYLSRGGADLDARLSLITEPDDGMASLLTMVRDASTSVDLEIYELDDPQVEGVIAADEQRGVAVRVLLSAGYYGASSTANGSAYDFLLAHGVAVRWSPSYFSLTHEKSLVVDGDRALIMTFNLVSKYYATGRDFGIVDDDASDVAAMERTFGDDWKGSDGDTGAVTDSSSASVGGNDGNVGDDLVWSPGAEPMLLALISGATKSLYIYNEEMADMDVTKALIDAAGRGVAVYVDMTGAEEWKWEFAELATAGVHVRTYADTPDVLYIHAKVIVADGGSASACAFIGSENFSAASLGENRELGIVIQDQKIIAQLMKTFTIDWRGATPFVP